MKQGKRKCSVCRNAGHTKRACTKRNVSAGKAKPVVIRIAAKPRRSPHVIDLRNAKPAVWNNVNAFFETPRVAVKRETIDLSALVREGNEKKKMAWRRF